ncbi:N6-adenosine-methyltransferase TMT1A-like [Daphnia carinata]|uniref:N6-adenosine-methyltransferase TMT1A-like n=1 Tax=Daphnia carinata TaxID=120202 RepID=UPI00257D2C81|nr:N6-adenosine-methyltransferase TMT1A-like [Daphnia carinata]
MSTPQDDGSKKSMGISTYLTVPLFVGLLLYLINKKFGKTIKNWLFALFWNRVMKEYHSTMRDMKKTHFDSMLEHKSTDVDQRKKSVLRVLEIGAGPGANFEFFPKNSKLTVVEPNAFFEPMFYENQHKYPDIKMEKFIVSNAEDMKEVEDNSIDIVVSTLVLCSVTSVERTLSEVQRILEPGGKFYYWEHVHDKPGTWLHWVQNLLTPLWSFLFDGCNLNRSIDQTVVGCKGFSHVEQKRFNAPLKKGISGLIRVHVMGQATK